MNQDKDLNTFNYNISVVDSTLEWLRKKPWVMFQLNLSASRELLFSIEIVCKKKKLFLNGGSCRAKVELNLLLQIRLCCSSSVLRMLYGPMMGGLLTQHLTFEWAAFIQGGLSGLAVSCIISLRDLFSPSSYLRTHVGEHSMYLVC